MVFLVSALSFLAKYLTAFLIVASLMDGYMLIASTDAIVTSSLFTSNPSVISFIVKNVFDSYPLAQTIQECTEKSERLNNFDQLFH